MIISQMFIWFWLDGVRVITDVWGLGWWVSQEVKEGITEMSDCIHFLLLQLQITKNLAE